MKKLIFITLGIILFVNNACAFDTGFLSQIKGDTRKVCNGRYWNGLDSVSKSAYLIADSLNINIPIHFAITILCLQQQGGKSDEMIQLLRANSEPTN